MSYVDTVVDTEASRQHDGHAADDVNRDAPKVEEANNIYKGQHDAEKHHKADGEVGKEDEGNCKDTGHGQAKVAPQLKANDLVCFPGSINLQV